MILGTLTTLSGLVYGLGFTKEYPLTNEYDKLACEFDTLWRKKYPIFGRRNFLNDAEKRKIELLRNDMNMITEKKEYQEIKNHNEKVERNAGLICWSGIFAVMCGLGGKVFFGDEKNPGLLVK